MARRLQVRPSGAASGRAQYLRQYKSHVDLHIVPRLGGTQLNRLSGPMVAGFRDWLLENDRSRALAKAIMASLRAVLTGLRSSELRGLSWGTGVDLDGRILHVVQRADENGVIGPPKSASGWRDIDLPETLVATLREWKLACPLGKLGLVFPNRQGNVEGHSNIQRRIWHPAQERAKTKRRYRFHDLRHFRASCLIAGGVNPKEVMAEMGHASIQMTFDTYGHLFPEDAAPRRARAGDIAAGVLAPQQCRKLAANRCFT